MSDLNPQTIYDIPQQLNKELLFDNFSITNSIPSATSTLSYINHSTNQINDKNNQTTVSNSDNDTINDSDDTDDEYDIDDKDINDVLSYKEFKQLNSVGSNLDINFAKIITINLCKDSLITIPNKIVDEFSLANNQMFKLSDQNTILKPIVIELPVAKKHNYTLKSFLFRDSSIVLLIIDETIQTKLINNYIKEIDHYSHGDSNIIILNLSKKNYVILPIIPQNTTIYWSLIHQKLRMIIKYWI
ncbi:hypothetical protein TBLA_0B05420 [Henningerozyma blattae CBS 6284]|uniref:Uncharacterized protein n=1 Tax=Henningerozyma blattae (strain ATCC 34711 / CBS 6284 / DSM 70876 / NBRC 10599 / NRRL Y-10934 / UCD 77-7) TaxID=1071380 RepID=I2GZ19_HENB6|nr:hypothetical protein TBLA_0B05420 [Tetrapisispora blattae CBS 6284]CCH59371.1 hypothetical protein TBLA_0B05420 [Tetrapisispora blattae CBS 6284]